LSDNRGMNKAIKDKRLDILRRYAKSSNLRMETIASGVGVSLRTIYNWIDGKGGVSILASPGLDAFLSQIDQVVTSERNREIERMDK
jgi:hypothetical protein